MRKTIIWIIVLSIIAIVFGFWFAGIAPSLVAKRAPTTTKLSVLPVDPTDPVKGNPSAPATVIIAASFNCPACKDASTTLDQAAASFRGKVKLVWKDLPENDSYSKQAAIAARCAQQQGKFWEYHDLLFTKQDISSQVDLFDEWATSLGLDAQKFSECRTSELPQRLVAQSITEAVALNISSIPYIQINGQTIIQGAENFAQMKSEIEQYIK